jgi:hypothetical protein
MDEIFEQFLRREKNRTRPPTVDAWPWVLKLFLYFDLMLISYDWETEIWRNSIKIFRSNNWCDGRC